MSDRQISPDHLEKLSENVIRYYRCIDASGLRNGLNENLYSPTKNYEIFPQQNHSARAIFELLLQGWDTVGLYDDDQFYRSAAACVCSGVELIAARR